MKGDVFQSSSVGRSQAMPAPGPPPPKPPSSQAAGGIKDDGDACMNDSASASVWFVVSQDGIEV
eukprot:1148393-Pelagomonas_calceolata.AAC.5